MSDHRFEKQFKFAKKMWETTTGQTYSGSDAEYSEILKKIQDLKSFFNEAA